MITVFVNSIKQLAIINLRSKRIYVYKENSLVLEFMKRRSKSRAPFQEKKFIPAIPLNLKEEQYLSGDHL